MYSYFAVHEHRHGNDGIRVRTDVPMTADAIIEALVAHDPSRFEIDRPEEALIVVETGSLDLVSIKDGAVEE